ncbi:MAG TPA: FAD-dependent oxidoreductase [Nocardioidaceae bacterium]|nr:FAD-dependent oxidoreductase [Nocardioidaceae bacterium]
MTSSQTRMVVVGADAAGMSAAHQALRGARKRGRELDVVVLEKTQHTSYSACGIPYWVAGDVSDPERLMARSAAEHREMGVDLRMGATATQVDLDQRTVSYVDASGTHRLHFDELVLATGAPPVIPEWARREDGELVSGVHPLKNLDDGAVWLDLLGTGSPTHRTGFRETRRAIVVGGGYIGIEMAEALIRRRWETTLLTRSTVMSGLDPDMSERVQSAMEAAGVEILPHTSVARLELRHDGSVSAVVTDDGRTLPADAVVLALGASPSSSLGADAGVPIGQFGGYLPDETGRVSEGVWAAGDCCEARHRITGEFAFIPLGTHANKQGRVVGENLTGGDVKFDGVLGTAITRFVTKSQHVEIARVGLNSAEAADAGFDPASLVTEGRTASGYMPEASPMATKVVVDRISRRLLGLQIVGGQGSGKRIDTAAAAIWGSMTVDDLAGMDLAYAPPFATVWEAVQLAARRLADRI